MVPGAGESEADLERRYGVTSAELRAWLAPNACDVIPVHEVHRWLALLEVLAAKENESA